MMCNPLQAGELNGRVLEKPVQKPKALVETHVWVDGICCGGRCERQVRPVAWAASWDGRTMRIETEE